jgi:aryl-alcohol dehydrogenase-like predicted oxidoreductase
MEQRPLGATGARLSVVGFGGIVVMDETPADAARFVAEAVDRGVNYFDVAPTYGNAQERLGPALEPHRNGVFLACKTTKRAAADAAAELENSLRVLRTDHVDLYQMHAVTTVAEAGRVLAPGGALEAFVAARTAGKTRFLGFSAHSEEAALMLMAAFAFDAVLFPWNWAAWYANGFGRRVLAGARSRGMGLLALKALARRSWDKDEPRPWPKCWYAPAATPAEAALALRFTLGLGVTAAVSPSHMELFRWACDAAQAPAPLTPAEEAALLKEARTLAPVFPEPSSK